MADLVGQVIAVWVSCGVPSAVAAKLAVDRYGATNDVRLVNNPVAEEHPDNRRFIADVSAWVGRPIEEAINPKFPNCSAVEVWEKERFMSSPHGASCTRALKKEARQVWEKVHKPDWHVLGFTAEERDRHERFTLTERQNVLPILIEACITRLRCFEILGAAGVAAPLTYYRGDPNANCEGCVKASSPTYWNHIRRVAPDVFAARCEQSRRLGVRLVRVRGERIFLDELKPTDEGRPMAGIDFECGIFCEEKAA